MILLANSLADPKWLPFDLRFSIGWKAPDPQTRRLPPTDPSPVAAWIPVVQPPSPSWVII